MIRPVGLPGISLPQSIRTPPAAADAAAARVADQPLTALSPPVDAGRVAELRAAISEGRYRIDPDAVAAKMIEGDLSAD